MQPHRYCVQHRAETFKRCRWTRWAGRPPHTDRRARPLGTSPEQVLDTSRLRCVEQRRSTSYLANPSPPCCRASAELTYRRGLSSAATPASARRQDCRPSRSLMPFSPPMLCGTGGNSHCRQQPTLGADASSAAQEGQARRHTQRCTGP